MSRVCEQSKGIEYETSHCLDDHENAREQECNYQPILGMAVFMVMVMSVTHEDQYPLKPFSIEISLNIKHHSSQESKVVLHSKVDGN
jgi:hypothetical protein